MNNPIRLAVLGLGTVGTGVVNLLKDNLTELKRRSGKDIIITHVGTRRQRDDIDSQIKQNADLLSIVASDDVDIVIEVIGGTTVAKDVITHAIQHGKHVVTANKALLAEHGNDIFALAEQHHVHVAFEASVAGGIPIIKVMRESLAANKIDWLAGIINGTGNFILSEMRDKARPFADVLSEAQQLGYAEADPTFDVEGTDAAHKLALLASIAFGMPLAFEHVYCEGITKITNQDVMYAQELGYRIKHLGFAKRRTLNDGNTGIELRVHPTLIPEDTLLANVNGVKNAVLIDAHPLGQTLYYGDGAGAGATASAVMADVMDLVRVLSVADGGHHVPHLSYHPDHLNTPTLLPAEQMFTGYYLRLTTLDHPGVLATITQILSDADINIDAILQQPDHDHGHDTLPNQQREPSANHAPNIVPVVILTQPITEKNMNDAIAKMEALDIIKDKIVRIRLEELD